MSIVKHTIQVLDPAANTDFYDRMIIGQKSSLAVANATNPAIAIAFTEPLPSAYSVFVQLNQNFPTFVTAKTATGFTVNIVGTVSGGACTMDLLVIQA